MIYGCGNLNLMDGSVYTIGSARQKHLTQIKRYIPHKHPKELKNDVAQVTAQEKRSHQAFLLENCFRSNNLSFITATSPTKDSKKTQKQKVNQT